MVFCRIFWITHCCIDVCWIRNLAAFNSLCIFKSVLRPFRQVLCQRTAGACLKQWSEWASGHTRRRNVAAAAVLRWRSQVLTAAFRCVTCVPF